MKMMRALCAVALAGLAFTASASAATEGWLDDYDKALAQAKAEKKLLFVLFTASDTKACMKQATEVFAPQQFKDYAAKNLVLLEVDFPRKNEKSSAERARNTDLNARFGGRGFPVIVLLDSDEKEQTRFVGYGGGGAKDMIAKLELFRK